MGFQVMSVVLFSSENDYNGQRSSNKKNLAAYKTHLCDPDEAMV